MIESRRALSAILKRVFRLKLAKVLWSLPESRKKFGQEQKIATLIRWIILFYPVKKVGAKKLTFYIFP